MATRFRFAGVVALRSRSLSCLVFAQPPRAPGSVEEVRALCLCVKAKKILDSENRNVFDQQRLRRLPCAPSQRGRMMFS
ncbi:hypothetical protein FOXYSP1_20286 [Fusarium oxysporum f. sp. phaseoli]